MLNYDPDEAVAHLAAADPALGALIAHVGPLGLRSRERSPTAFDALLRSIVYQQLSGKAAATIHGRVLALLGNAVPTPEAVISLDDETLRGAGVSRAKTKAIKDLAAKTLDGIVPDWPVLETLPDEEILERVTAVWGIGTWTVQMLLLFHLGRPDVLPTGDLGVQRGCQLLYGLDALPSPNELKAYAEPWRPYRSAASWYLWRAVDTPVG